MQTARHPKAKTFVQQKLFTGLKSFAELEQRIADFTGEQAKGDAFEVFAEAYLATQRKHDAVEVWPLSAVPLNLLEELGLTTNDYGVDGILQTTLGQLNVYQVKFRSGRQPLTWRELSTFMGLADSPNIHSRVLFTNCDDLPAVMNERKGFFCIRGSDLDRLEESDFRTIESWLSQAHVPTARKQPLRHQDEALDVLLPALREYDRVTGIMACGTGKTLVALWVAERMQSQTILVLVPSLALLRQTLHEWLHETSLPSLAYLCVCSDPTVKQDLDAIATAQSDLDFPVTTDRRSVREFLAAPFTGVKIIFSTYQSARVVGEALQKGEVFDLGIFDEAHKTAGREGRNYAFALEDSNLPIRKRLFLTATPRHYNPQRKDKEGNAQLVFSMGKPQVYGEQAYRLTFAEAARRGIICNYKVVISVITSDMITNELLSRGEVLVNGDPIRARQVANQLALKDAIAKYGVSKVFTFHRTVKSAESFVADGSEGIGTHLSGVRSSGFSRSGPPEGGTPNFQTFHVNGTMPTARREHVMRDFRDAPRAVMSNARCLTEGVDVPAVDMIAFLSPRRSRVDIVQATGRAMRRAPGKSTGYVLVPLYLEQAASESIEEAVNRADFDEVWDVLQSLQEQDEALAETISQIREERGRTRGYNDTRFGERVDIWGPEISLSVLRRTITTTCIERLGETWDERYGQLKAYKELHGHCRVPSVFLENPQLGIWVFVQRQTRKAGRLSQERVRKLEHIGFSWNPTDEFWESMFAALLEFKQTHGNCNVPIDHRENPELGIWARNQRNQNQSGVLDAEHYRRLREIGFVWDLKDDAWNKMFSVLLKYKLKHKNCNVPRDWPEDQRLSTWVSAQRQARKNGRLDKIRLHRLKKIGFVWNRRPKVTEGLGDHFSGCNSATRTSAWLEEKWAVVWEQNFADLIAYKSEFGDCNVPKNWPNNPKLANWINAQRQRKNNGSLNSERIRRLDEIGFFWDLKTIAWNVKFDCLVEYKRKHGNCKVPQKWPENPQLAAWVNAQRAARSNDTISQERIRNLDEIGFTWRGK